MVAVKGSEPDSSAFAAAALAVVKFHVHIEMGPFGGILIVLVDLTSCAERTLGASSAATLPINVFPIKIPSSHA